MNFRRRMELKPVNPNLHALRRAAEPAQGISGHGDVM